MRESSNRNYGIDALRLLLMFMVCILHTLGHGGVLGALTPEMGGYKLAWFGEISCYCAVDAFVMITGYMASNRPPRYSKIVNLWFQVFFYSCVITLILAAVGYNVDLGVKEIIKMSMPVIFNRYWFFTAYFGLFLVAPIFNKWLFSIDEIVARRALVFIVMLFTVMGLLTDPFNTGWGYSLAWLCIIYCIGVLARRCHLFETKSTPVLLLYLVLSITITWLFKIVLGRGALISYISPTVVFNAILLVVLFSRLNLKGTIISKLSPLAFGIYLLQNNPVIWNNIIAGSMKDVPLSPFLTGTFTVLGFAAALFLAGLAVDFIRLQLFKLLHIDRLSNKVVNAISSLLDKLCWLVEKLF